MPAFAARSIVLAACAAALSSPLAIAAGKAHEHGVASLDVAVEAQRVTLLLDVPLDNLLGFERAPRTEAERQQADAALAKLNDGAALFRIDPAASCTPTRAVVDAPVLRPGATPAEKEGHEDLAASYEFACKDGHRAGFVEVGLFEAFARLKRIDVQAVGRKGQLKATLKRPVSRLPLAR